MYLLKYKIHYIRLKIREDCIKIVSFSTRHIISHQFRKARSCLAIVCLQGIVLLCNTYNVAHHLLWYTHLFHSPI